MPRLDRVKALLRVLPIAGGRLPPLQSPTNHDRIRRGSNLLPGTMQLLHHLQNYTKKSPPNLPFSHPENGSKCGKNIWSKTGENPLKSRGLTGFSVEKTVENVKTFGEFSTVYGNGKGRFTPISTLSGESRCGKVDNLVENPQNGEFSPKIIHNVEFS